MVFGLGPGEEVQKYQRSRESARHIHPEVIDILMSTADRPSEGMHKYHTILFFKTLDYNQNSTYLNSKALADPTGGRGVGRQGSPRRSKSIHFHAIFGKNNRYADPLWELAPLLPDKSWIRH